MGPFEPGSRGAVSRVIWTHCRGIRAAEPATDRALASAIKNRGLDPLPGLTTIRRSVAATRV